MELATSRYLLLTSFRRDGTPVGTPFGALHRDGRSYCFTNARSGKVRRVRREPRVTLAACTQRGDTLGPAIEARARVLGGAEADELAAAFDALWTRQFGVLWRVQKIVERLRGMKRVVIEISPVT